MQHARTWRGGLRRCSAGHSETAPSLSPPRPLSKPLRMLSSPKVGGRADKPLSKAGGASLPRKLPGDEASQTTPAPTELLDNFPIQVTRPYLPPLDEFLPLLKQIWDRRWLTNLGPFHQQFEQALQEPLGAE